MKPTAMSLVAQLVFFRTRCIPVVTRCSVGYSLDARCSANTFKAKYSTEADARQPLISRSAINLLSVHTKCLSASTWCLTGYNRNPQYYPITTIQVARYAAPAPNWRLNGVQNDLEKPEIKDIQFKAVYHANRRKIIASVLLSRVKTKTTLVAAIFTPFMLAFKYYNLLNVQELEHFYFLIAVLVGSSSAFSLLTVNSVRTLSLSSDEKLLKIKYFNLWGHLCYRVVPVDDVIPKHEVKQSFLRDPIIMKLNSSPEHYLLHIKGCKANQKLLNVVIGKL